MEKEKATAHTHTHAQQQEQNNNKRKHARSFISQINCIASKINKSFGWEKVCLAYSLSQRRLLLGHAQHTHTHEPYFKDIVNIPPRDDFHSLRKIAFGACFTLHRSRNDKERDSTCVTPTYQFNNFGLIPCFILSPIPGFRWSFLSSPPPVVRLAEIPGCCVRNPFHFVQCHRDSHII